MTISLNFLQEVIWYALMDVGLRTCVFLFVFKDNNSRQEVESNCIDSSCSFRLEIFCSLKGAVEWNIPRASSTRSWRSSTWLLIVSSHEVLYLTWSVPSSYLQRSDLYTNVVCKELSWVRTADNRSILLERVLSFWTEAAKAICTSEQDLLNSVRLSSRASKAT